MPLTNRLGDRFTQANGVRTILCEGLSEHPNYLAVGLCSAAAACCAFALLRVDRRSREGGGDSLGDPVSCTFGRIVLNVGIDRLRPCVGVPKDGAGQRKRFTG
jgi:hypothetical protein